MTSSSMRTWAGESRTNRTAQATSSGVSITARACASGTFGRRPQEVRVDVAGAEVAGADAVPGLLRVEGLAHRGQRGLARGVRDAGAGGEAPPGEGRHDDDLTTGGAQVGQRGVDDGDDPRQVGGRRRR